MRMTEGYFMPTELLPLCRLMDDRWNLHVHLASYNYTNSMYAVGLLGKMGTVVYCTNLLVGAP